MACSLPHTDSEVEALVQKLIDEDKGRQNAILDLALQFENSCTVKDDLRNAYEKCTDISQESRALIDSFLKEGSDKDYELNLSMYGKAAKLEKQMDAKLAWLLEKYYYRSQESVGCSSSQADLYLTEKELHQLHLDEEALRETLEEQLSSSTRVEPSPSTPNPVRIIPGPASIVQQAKLLKERDILLGWDGALMSTQEYMQKVVEDDDFNSVACVSATNYVDAFGGTVTGCLRDIDNFLKKGKLEQVVAIVKSRSPNMFGDLNVTLKDLSDTIPRTIHYKVLDVGSYEKDITVEAAMILANVSVFTPKPSQHYLNITMRNVIEGAISQQMTGFCPRIHSDLLPKGIIHFSLHPPKKCSARLYVVPSGITARCLAFKCYATTESLHVDGKTSGNLLSSVVGGPDKSQRCELIYVYVNSDDFEKNLEELFSEIKSMIQIGNKSDAIDLLEANYEAVREQMVSGGKTVEEAATLDVIALGYMAIGDFKMVEAVLNKLNEIVHDLSDDEPLLDSILTHMGSMHSALGRYEKSMILYKRVLEILERNHGSSSTSLVMPLLGMGKALGSVGRATKAIDIYHRAISILESNMGLESKELVVPLTTLGNLFLNEGKAEDAENAFMRLYKTQAIVGIYTQLYGKDDERVGMAMCSLANAKCAKGDAEAAIKLYRSALYVLENSESMNLDDGILEKTRIDLAELLHVVGRENEGRQLLEECLSITKKCKGEDDPSFVTHLTNLATSYSRSKNYVEAERLLRCSLQILERTLGHDDPSITFVMLQLAVTLYNLKQDEEAEQMALEVLRIREKAFGDASLPVGEALDCLICIQNRIGRDDGEILELLKRNLNIQETAFGHESEQVIGTLKKILFYMDKLGIKDQKFPFQRRLSLLRNKFKEQVQY
ncbi:nephrocystin-3 isoform X2 [Tanacetum coccineum]